MRARARPRCTVSTPDFWPVAITWNTSDSGTFLRLPSITLSPFADLIEERGRPHWHAQAEVGVGGVGGHPAPGGPLQQPPLDEERLVDLFERGAVFTDGGGERVQTDRSAHELLDDGSEDGPVAPVESRGVDAEGVERGSRAGESDGRVARHLGIVAHPPQEPLGDAHGAPGAVAYLERRRL